jgi:hypothetical protein
MKKLWLNIRIFFTLLFKGLKNANDIAFTGNKDTDIGNGSSIEQQKEVQSVYKDMLKGEITQEVIELRHEMYFAERASKKYKYTGNGRAVKMNDIIKYNGDLETSDGLEISIVQENKEDIGSLLDYEIYNIGNEVALGEKSQGDLSKTKQKKFTINIKRDFLAKFNIEQYTEKIVIKQLNDDESIIDIYVYQYMKQFNNIHKLFLKQIEQIYTGDIRNDIIEFNSISFITNNAYGAEDLLEFEFNNIQFENIIRFNEFYVLRFLGKNVKYGNDLLNDIYDEKTAKLNEEHAPRNNNMLEWNLALEDIEENNKADEAIDLIKQELHD